MLYSFNVNVIKIAMHVLHDIHFETIEDTRKTSELSKIQNRRTDSFSVHERAFKLNWQQRTGSWNCNDRKRNLLNFNSTQLMHFGL